MPVLSLALLGPFAAAINGVTLANFRTKSGQALLIYLTVEGRGGSPIRREFLAELLYPGLTPASSKKNLRQTLYELRKIVAAQASAGDGPLVVADRQSVVLNPEWTVELDVIRFESELAGNKLKQLELAATLYRGEFLVDFYLPENVDFEAWSAGWRAFYRRQAVKLLASLVNQLLSAGELDRAESYARRQIALDNLNEGAARQLMMALAAQDQRSAALAEYELLRRRLAEELETAPATETQDLYWRIQAGETALSEDSAANLAELALDLPDAHPHQPLSNVVPNNLPAQLTPFIGREQELAEGERLLCSELPSRLITMLGPGGSGKSRLAIEIARRRVEEKSETFADGIWYVPLAALGDAAGVIPEIAKNINLIFTADDTPKEQQLIDYLANKKLLLILDNYEHLLNGPSPPLPATILSQSSTIQIIVTSRNRLNIRGEHLLPVGGLALPKAGQIPEYKEAGQFSAVELFKESAKRVSPDFELDQLNWPVIVQLCRLVEGLPLAIELAATWMEILAPEEIMAELKRSIDFLSAEWTDMPDRQRSMRAVFGASWDLLAPAEQHALQRLSVFRGSFGRDAAMTVALADLKVLLALVNKSWLTRNSSNEFHFHELLRQYTLEKLERDEGEWRMARGLHAAYFADWLEQMGLAVRGHGQKEALKALAQSFENIRQAWEWLAVQGQLSSLTRKMLPAITLFCAAKARGDELQAMVSTAQATLKTLGEETSDAAILDTAGLAVGYGSFVTRHLEGGNQSFELPDEAGRKIWRTFQTIDPLQIDGLWQVTATVIYAWITKSYLETTRRLKKLITIYREGNVEWSQAFAMKNLGLVYSELLSFSTSDFFLQSGSAEIDRQHSVEAIHLLRYAAQIFEKLGDKSELADSLRLIGGHYQYKNPELALEPLMKAKALFDELGDWVMASRILSIMAHGSLWSGDIHNAFGYYQEKRQLLESKGNRTYMAAAYGQEAIWALRYSGIDHARQLRLKAQKLEEVYGPLSHLTWTLWELGDIERVAGNLNLAYDYYEQANVLIEQEDMPYARVHYPRGLADCSLVKGNSGAAIDLFLDSLNKAQKISYPWAVCYALCGLGRAHVAARNFSEAVAYCLEALRYSQDIQQNDLSMIALAGLAAIKTNTGDFHEGFLLASFVYHHHLSWLETKSQALLVIDNVANTLTEETAVGIRQRALSMTKEEIIALVLSQESSKEG